MKEPRLKPGFPWLKLSGHYGGAGGVARRGPRILISRNRMRSSPVREHNKGPGVPAEPMRAPLHPSTRTSKHRCGGNAVARDPVATFLRMEPELVFAPLTRAQKGG